jgi:hypothetical protein
VTEVRFQRGSLFDPVVEADFGPPLHRPESGTGKVSPDHQAAAHLWLDERTAARLYEMRHCLYEDPARPSLHVLTRPFGVRGVIRQEDQPFTLTLKSSNPRACT